MFEFPRYLFLPVKNVFLNSPRAYLVLRHPRAFLAFQLDGIFVGATRGQEMRNAMIVSASGLTVALLFSDAWGLHGLLAAFIGYLGLRGVSLWWHIDRVYAQADAPLQQHS